MWLEHQDKYLWDKKLRIHLSTGDQWTVQLIKFLWEKFFELWKIRNVKVHRTDEKATYQLKAERYQTIVKTMFHLQDRLEVVDCQCMFQSLAEVEEFLLTKFFAYIKTFLDTW